MYTFTPFVITDTAMNVHRGMTGQNTDRKNDASRVENFNALYLVALVT